ncbi:MAG: hydroxymethylglutaryl-CoA lyase, partial [Pseudomonadota bacterium]
MSSNASQQRERVEIVEVGPRDGIQSQPTLLTTEQKLTFVERLISAGVRKIEVASFVNPKRVPQMADVDELLARLPRPSGVRYLGLVLNERGYERALATRIHEVNCVVVATDTFNQRNQRVTTQESLEAVGRIAQAAARDGVTCGVTIGAAFGCPFEGEVPPERVVDLVKALEDYGVPEIALADTIGVAAPSDVSHLLGLLAQAGSPPPRCHFHNTRNTGLANAYAALEAGVRALDASCGGVGGCPFAPAATGNIGTEDVLYMIDRMGFDAGID